VSESYAAHASSVSSGERLAEQVGIEGIDRIVAFEVPLTMRFRRVERRRGLLLHGPYGWGEWSPFDEYDDEVAATWLDSALSSALTPTPTALHRAVPVNVTVPVVSPEQARRIVSGSGCRTAKVKVGEPGQEVADDVARLRAVRDALGPDGAIRIDANAAWDLAAALDHVPRLEEAARGLDYVEQPCAMLEDLAAVRAKTGVRVAADESIRLQHADPSLLREAVDVAVLKVQPLGGVAAARDLAVTLGLAIVVSSALETSIGLAAGVRLAAALESAPLPGGLATSLLLAEDVVRSSLVPIDGQIDVARAAPDAHDLRTDLAEIDTDLAQVLVSRLMRAASLRVGRGAP
jgi:O-succinylbenzoate synthase